MRTLTVAAVSPTIALLIASFCYAGPARFWISPFPDDPFWSGLDQQGQSDTLEIDLIANPMDQVNSKQRLYIWAQPDSTTAGLKDISLNVVSFNRSGNAVIDFLDGNKIDPNGEEPTLGNPGNSPSRFTSVRDGRTRYPLNEDLELTTLPVNEISVAQPDAIKGLIGENVGVLPDTNMTTEIPRPGLGIGPGCLPGDLACTPHPGVSTPQGDVWRVGAFTIQSLQSRTGEVDLHLQIGELGMRHFGGNTADTDVIFSATSTSSQVYNAGLGADLNEGRQDTNFASDAPEVRVFVSNTLTGDYDEDGVVGGKDFILWQRLAGSTQFLPNRRFGVNGPIGQADLSAWRANYGKTIEPSATMAVPEPESLLLAVIFVVSGICAFRHEMRAFRIAFAVVTTVLATSQLVKPCVAQTLTWDGAAGTGFWGGNNWVEGGYGSIPESTLDLQFGNLGEPSNIETFLFNTSASGEERVPRSINVSRTRGSVTIAPAPIGGDQSHLLRLRSGGINVQNSNSRLVIETNTRLRVGQTWAVQDAAGELVVRDGASTKTLDLNGNELTINGPGNTTIRTDIFNSGSIDKKGDGTLTLTGNNTFTGGIAVNNGELDIASDASIGSGHLQINGARLFVTGNTNIDNPITFDNNAGGDVNVPNFVNVFQNDVEFSGSIVGGQWAKRGSGTLEVSGSNTGFVGVENGTLLMTNPSALQAGADISGGARLWAATSGNWNSSATLSGSGKFEKSGVGRLTLNGTTTDFAGDYEIEGGQLAMSPGRYNNRPIQTNRSTAEAVFLGGGTYSGGITGSGKLIKEGSGELLLTGSNGYTAGTIIRGGVLSGDASNIRGTVTLENNSGLKVTGSGAFGNSILGSGNLTKVGNDRLLLGGNNTFSGSITVLDGVLAGDTTSIQQPVSVSSGATLEFTFSSGTRTFGQQISGAGGLTKSGGGELTISAPNSYTGNTVVSNGTLRLGNDNRISDSSSVIIENSGRLDLNDYTEAISHLSGLGTVDLGTGTLLLGQYNNSSTFAGSIVGAGDVVKIGSGILTLSGSSTYSGATDIQSGTLEIIGSNRISNDSDVNVAAGATFDLNGNSETIDLLTGSGVISLGSGALGVGTTGGPLTSSVFSGSIQGEGGSLQKLGQGNLGLTGSNTYTGTTNITSGSISIGGNERLSDSSALHVNAGALFDLNNNTQTIDQLSGSGDIAIGAGLFRVGANNASSIYTGEIRGTSGTLEKLGTGTLTLSGNNIYQNGTIISDGSLVVSASNLPGDTEVNGSGKLVLSAGSGTYSGDISGTGTLRKETSSTVSLAGNNTHTGGTEIAGGVLSANLNSLQGDVAMSNDSELWLTVTSNNPGTYTGNISGAGSLRKAVEGGGKLTLVGSNSYTGGTSVEAGILEGNSSSLQGAISVDSGAEVRFSQSAAGSFVGTLSGGGVLRKQGAGNLTIGGATTHTGGTFVEAGKLVGNTTSLQGDISSDTEVVISQSSNGTFAANLSGPGKLTKIKVGEITVAGPNSYSGGTEVLAGKLIANAGQSLGTGDVFIAEGAILGGTATIQGSVTGGGNVTPGNSPGILTINGDYTMSPTSTLEIEVEGTGTAGVDYDQLRVGGEVSIANGTLLFDFTNNPGPMLGDNISFIETFGGGGILAVPSGDEPKINTTGLDPASNLAVRVTSNVGVGGTVDMTLVPSGNIFFDGTSATTNWFTDVDWSTNLSPISEDNTVVGGNVFVQVGVPQRVVVNNSVMGSPDIAQVRQLTVGDTAQSIVVEIESELHSGTGDITIAENGGIELDGGILSVTSARSIQVTESGMLSGNGMVAGSVDVGTTAAVGDAMLSPGMATAGMEVGTIQIDGAYTQGSDGVFAIDITGDDSGGNHDFIDVSENVTLGGTLKVDLSDITTIDTDDVYTILTAGSVNEEFDEIEVVGNSDYYISIDYGQGFAPTSGLAAASSGDSGDVDLRILGMGDADGDNDVDQEDARVFSAVLLDNSLLGFRLSETKNATNNFKDAFDFYTEGAPNGQRIIDFDDIAGFVDRLSASQGMTLQTAYAVFGAAYQEAQNGAQVPEPSSLLLTMLTVGICSCRSTRRS